MSQGGEVKPRAYRRHRFAKRYTRADIEVLAAVDEAHETLSGPATQKILQRAWHEFQDGQCERLARLSVAQLYRLRKSGTYRHRRSPINLPDLRRWRSENGANPIRKGGRDICAWTPCIKVTCMGADLGSLAEPVLEAMLAQFPFHIRAFIPTTPASSSTTPWPRCSFKLLVEQTKSRLRHDNGLAESKNGWVIRKHIGYGHIASTHAEAFDEFYRLHFNPYLNFHRPCGVPEVTVTAKGKQKHVYRWYATPWENGRVENEENQTQVSLRFAQPLEIAARFPHSHRPCNFCVSKHSKPNSRTETLAADRFAPAFRPILQ